MKTGTLIREARIKKGMTQEELAAETKMNVRTIQRIESGEVTPRAYTLKTIAAVLDIEPSLFSGEHAYKERSSKAWLVYLHLSGLLFIPSVMIWIFEKDEIKGIREHGIDVINFQLSMLVILLPFLILPFPPAPLLIGIFTFFVVILNTIRVIRNRPYHYPLTISFLKP